ncbi:MAG: SHOCT domain-containing protein [Anaerolineae bacterium]
MMFFGWLLGLLGLGALAYGLGWRPEEQRGAKGAKSALEVLNERYARSEISREEYQSMREDLEH